MKIFIFFIIISIAINAEEFATPLEGIIKPVYQAKISMSTEGKAEKILLKEGSKVRKGEVILSLDSALQRIETRRRKLLVEDTIKRDSLQKNLKILKDILDKRQELYDATKSISANELNQLKMQYINTEAELEATIINDKKELIEYEISKKILETYDLRAPVNGIITRIEPKIGEWVQMGKEIVEIVNTDVCFVEIDLTAKEFQSVSVGSKVKLKIFNGRDTFIRAGKIKFISTVADSSSRLIRSKIEFDNKDGKAIPGLSAELILK